MPDEILRFPRAAVVGEVSRCCEHDAAEIGQPPGLEARVGKLTQPNGEIVAVLDEIDIAVGQIELDIDLGMQLEER